LDVNHIVNAKKFEEEMIGFKKKQKKEKLQRK
jgi:hypothetical protein